MNSARINSMWIGIVKESLRVGLGVEDIAKQLDCDVESIRLEVSILRLSGELKTMFERVGV